MPKKVSSRLLKRVGDRLREARHKRDLSQEKVAFSAGLDRSYVSGIERGEFNISLLALARIAKVLGVRLSALLDGE